VGRILSNKLPEFATTSRPRGTSAKPPLLSRELHNAAVQMTCAAVFEWADALSRRAVCDELPIEQQLQLQLSQHYWYSILSQPLFLTTSYLTPSYHEWNERDRTRPNSTRADEIITISSDLFFIQTASTLAFTQPKESNATTTFPRLPVPSNYRFLRERSRTRGFDVNHTFVPENCPRSGFSACEDPRVHRTG